MIYKYKIIYSNLNKSKMLKGGTNSTSSSTTSSLTTSSIAEVHNKLSMYQLILNLLWSLRAVIGAVKEPRRDDGADDNYERINKNRQNNEKFNIFFDINNDFKYFRDINLYTVNIDFNDIDSYNLFFDNGKMNLKYNEIAFEYSTVKFFDSVNDYFNLIEKLLDVLNFEGKLFIPIKTSHFGGRNIIIGNNNELINPFNNLNSNVVLDPRRRELNIKFNELFNTLNIDDFILLDDKTFVLSENKKIEIQSEGYKYSLEEIIIIKNDIYYFPNKDYFKDLFKERLFYTIDDFNTKYEFIEEPYPFEPNDYLKKQNYNEPYIVILKNYYKKNDINYFPNIDYFKDLFKEKLFYTIDDFNTKYEFIEEPYPFEPNDYLKTQT